MLRLMEKHDLYQGYQLKRRQMNALLSHLSYTLEPLNSPFNVGNVEVRELASLIGTLVSTFPAIEYGPLYYRNLEEDKKIALKLNKGKWDRIVHLSQVSIADIKWWLSHIENAPSPISHGEPALIITSDASLKGWGAVCNGIRTGGAWTTQEGTEQDADGQSNRRPHCSILASPKVLSHTYENVDRQACASVSETDPATAAGKPEHASPSSRETEVVGMQSIRHAFKSRGLSDTATNLLMSSW
ncbi:transposon ty3-i Gag-Pol polyprotein [Plakobranchus ocellatus]|uniref:Transposon ty3-i Gag-Pol polyprotein n=1 Tax=Plakobranchus ocellatus TaxID=259542 RepID=A0AAV4D459_9GAST|nr:transposon ty3-i Gag-Pol polyprotein [Plakobranchus ocellatus]